MPKTTQQDSEETNQNRQMLASKLFSQATFPGHGPQTGTQVRQYPAKPGGPQGLLHFRESCMVGCLEAVAAGSGECHEPGISYLTFPWTSLQYVLQVTCCLATSPPGMSPSNRGNRQHVASGTGGQAHEERGSHRTPLRSSFLPPGAYRGQVWKEGPGLTQERLGQGGSGAPCPGAFHGPAPSHFGPSAFDSHLLPSPSCATSKP